MAFAEAEEWSVAVVMAWLPWVSASDWAELEFVACAELDDVPSAWASALLAVALAVA
jgi:hypothetical protein